MGQDFRHRWHHRCPDPRVLPISSLSLLDPRYCTLTHCPNPIPGPVMDSNDAISSENQFFQTRVERTTSRSHARVNTDPVVQIGRRSSFQRNEFHSSSASRLSAAPFGRSWDFSRLKDPVVV